MLGCLLFSKFVPVKISINRPDTQLNYRPLHEVIPAAGFSKVMVERSGRQ
jgi:hypothetical protein